MHEVPCMLRCGMLPTVRRGLLSTLSLLALEAIVAAELSFDLPQQQMNERETDRGRLRV